MAAGRVIDRFMFLSTFDVMLVCIFCPVFYTQMETHTRIPKLTGGNNKWGGGDSFRSVR